MNYVLDASAMIAFLRGEQGAERVSAVLSNPGNICCAHAINLCEVFYDFHRAQGLATASEAVSDLQAIGVRTDSSFEPEFWQGAGILKSSLRRVSLADCFALHLSQRLGASLLTADHHEFDVITEHREFQIEFIR